MSCKLIKLTTGETIIAMVVSETSSYVEIHRAIKILMTPKGTDSYAILMVKWDAAMDFEKPVKVFKTSIVSVAEPEAQFKKSYMEVFEEYENKNEFLEDNVEIKTVDDLANEIDQLMNMFKASANNTLH
jgi:hypothetical protein